MHFRTFTVTGTRPAPRTEHYNYRRLHESLQNVKPADVYYGRRPAILSRREQMKRETPAQRKRMNHRAA
jgi:hypothetical protein